MLKVFMWQIIFEIFAQTPKRRQHVKKYVRDYIECQRSRDWTIQYLLQPFVLVEEVDVIRRIVLIIARSYSNIERKKYVRPE